ncbi:hypothetical protein FOZ60_000004 [Perkinsus olseni]|uniref:Uncharacterized protein n=1 Tax=Perkinsus olseni TaxID=32597 RepID=A0A7J6PNP8_PEROL|nr:hypothetical protein FOZ60_000004 [Perkinsus olseni]
MTVPREDYEGLKEYVRLLEQKLRRCAEEQERLERMHSREMRHRQKLYDEDLKKLRRLLYDESQREVKLNRSLLRLRQQWRGLIASIQNTRTGFEAEITDNDSSSGSPYSIPEAARDVLRLLPADSWFSWDRLRVTKNMTRLCDRVLFGINGVEIDLKNFKAGLPELFRVKEVVTLRRTPAAPVVHTNDRVVSNDRTIVSNSWGIASLIEHY